MGWLWASSKGPTPPPQESQPPESFTQPTSSIPPSTTSNSPPSPRNPPLSRDEAADAELRAFLESLQEGYAPPSSALTSTRPSPSFPSQSSLSSDLITPASIHPTNLSCRTLFDSAFYCASLGGQFVNIYRYGQLRSCSQEWADFWWCMRTNRGFMSTDEREARVLERGMRRETEKYRGENRVSSEDVWEARKWKVPQGAMQGNLEAVMEEARRRAKGADGGGLGGGI